MKYACLGVTILFALLVVAACGSQAPTVVPTGAQTSAPTSSAPEPTASLPTPAPTPALEPTTPLPTLAPTAEPTAIMGAEEMATPQPASTLTPQSAPIPTLRSRDLPRPLGVVELTTDGDCKRTFGDRCLQIAVTCPRINDAAAKLRVTGTGSSGTVVLTTGRRGTGWYRAGGQSTEGRDITNVMMDALLAEGYRLIEVAWEEPGIWEGPGGSISLACRSATIFNWIYRNFHGEGFFAAQGNSGGSSQVAFSLAYYGLHEVLDLANLSGGPPPCPISIGGKLNFREQGKCLVGERLWDDSREPILLGNPLLQYPNTTVRFFLGETEPSLSIIESANAYHNAIEAKKSMQIVPNTAHQVHRTEEGTGALIASIKQAAGASPECPTPVPPPTPTPTPDPTATPKPPATTAVSHLGGISG